MTNTKVFVDRHLLDRVAHDTLFHNAELHPHMDHSLEPHNLPVVYMRLRRRKNSREHKASQKVDKQRYPYKHPPDTS